MPEQQLLWQVLLFQPVTESSWLTPAKEGWRSAPRQPFAAPHSTFSERCLCYNSLTLRGGHSWHPKYETEWTPGILVPSSALFATAGCSGTGSKEHLCPEHNSCQYLRLNSRAASLPKDVLQKTALQKTERMEAGSIFLSFRVLPANLIISLFFTVQLPVSESQTTAAGREEQLTSLSTLKHQQSLNNLSYLKVT